MRNIICTLAIAMLVSCGGGGTSGGQLPMDWKPALPGLGTVEPSPPSVKGSPTLADLKAALAIEFEKLGVDPGKTASSAPSGAGAKVADLYVFNSWDPDTLAETISVTWTERFPGDNDFNGEVNLSDLQMLALYWEQEATYRDFIFSKGIEGISSTNPVFDENIPDQAKNWVLCQVDADNNGEINLADISGIAQHFQQSLGGYNVYRRKAGQASFTRLPNPGHPGAPVTFYRDQAHQPGTATPLLARPPRYEFVDHDYSTGYREYYVVAADNEGNEWDGSPYVLPKFVNDPEFRNPLVSIAVNNHTGLRFFEPGNMIELYPSYSRSYGFFNSIVEFAYDVDGDGDYDYVFGDHTPLQITLDNEGVFLIRLRVTDENGMMGFAETPIFVGENHPAVLDMQIKVSDEFVPAVVTFSSTGTRDPDTITGISYAYWRPGEESQSTGKSATIREPGDYACRMTVTDMFGTESTMEGSFSMGVGGYINPGWGFAEVGDSTARGITAVSMRGVPAITFGDTVDGLPAIVYKSALDQSGSEWGPSALIDNDLYDYGLFPPRLHEVEGVPAIVYFDGNLSYGNAKYAHALSADGSEWTEPVTFASGMFTMPALGISNGVPVVVTGGFTVNQFTALDPLGDSWGEGQPLEDQYGIVVDWFNINGQEGFLVNGGGNRLYLRAQDTAGPWDEAISLPENVGNLLQPHAICNGLLTYWNIPNSQSLEIEQYQTTNRNPKNWSYPNVISLPPETWLSAYDVLVIDGTPWMCWYAGYRFELQAMQANDAQATSWGEPVVITSYGDVGSGCKLVEVNGQPGIVYNDKSTDKLMIAIRD